MGSSTGPSQVFKQKRWQRGARGAMFPVADSVDTQDSNITGGRFRDSFHHTQDLIDEPDMSLPSPPPKVPPLPHQPSRQPTFPRDSEPRSPVVEEPYLMAADSSYDPILPEEGIDDSVQLIDFGEGDPGAAGRSHRRSPSPGALSHSSSLLRRRSPSPLGEISVGEPLRRSTDTLSRHSSHRSIPLSIPAKSSDCGVQVGEPSDSLAAASSSRGSDILAASTPDPMYSPRHGLSRAPTQVFDDDNGIVDEDDLRSTQV